MRARFLAAGALLAAACGEGGAGPVIDDVLPSAARAGETVEILGDRFCGEEDAAADREPCAEGVAAFVSFGDGAEVLRSEAERYGQRRITVELPEEAPLGATVIVVTREGVASNPAPFEVLE